MMQSFCKRILCLAIVTQMLFSCSWWPPVPQTTDSQTNTSLNAIAANQRLLKLADTDVLLKFNNQMLAAQMQSSLMQYLSESGQFLPQSIHVKFDKQFIGLTANLLVMDDLGEALKVSATGEIRLAASADGLEWLPSLDQIQISSSDFTFAGGTYPEPVPELEQQLLQLINAAIKKGQGSSRYNHISFQAVPMAKVEIGTRLLSFNDVTVSQSVQLKGMFFVTGSAVLIEKSSTSFLLDVSFKPDLATCPADIRVSRAMFTRNIESREPIGANQNMDDADDLRFFFSEISGATRPMTVIHYWFADGQAVVVEELPVGPSEKWRTWSSKGNVGIPATHWRVLVVEKQSGCILYSQSIRTVDKHPFTALKPVDSGQHVFADYQQAFRSRMADFPSALAQPEISLIEIRSHFLKDVFQSGLNDLQIETVFDPVDLQTGNQLADLSPFETENIVCQSQQCAEPLICSTNIAHCKRQRDNRECSSCLFHNPLNNRCMQMEEDPICVAAKNRQNAIYESDREACIASAELNRQDCEQLSRQIAQSCEIESRAARSACEASKMEIASLKAGAMLARVKADSHISGRISTLFSSFKISGDFEQLQQDITLKTRLSIQGQLDFEPTSSQWPFSSCINAWQGEFSNRAISATRLNSMIAPLLVHKDTFTAAWSGIVLPLAMTSSPIESVLVANPRLLAACSIGLTVQQVEQAISGEDADFFTGKLKLIVQPLATRIELNPATIEFAGHNYTGLAQSSTGFVSYTMNAGNKTLRQ